MATITFDSLRIADKLKTAGFTAEQAEAVVRVIVETQDELVTRNDLNSALSPLRTDLAVIKAEMTQIKWLQGLVIGGIVAILAKVLSH
jgi:hypothetical protein